MHIIRGPGERSAGANISPAPAKFSDLVQLIIGYMFVGSLLVGVIVFFALRGQGSDVEHNNRDLTIEEGANDIQINDQRRILDELRANKRAPQLLYPLDQVVIDSQVDLEWKYAEHTELASYVVQVIPVKLYKGGIESSRLGIVCSFDATNSVNQESLFPTPLFTNGWDDLASGEYIWRVAPGFLPAQEEGCYKIQDRSDETLQGFDWSGYGAFTVFASRIDRIRHSRTIRVGIPWVQGQPSISTGTNNGPEEFYQRLGNYLVGCLKYNGGIVKYDSEACQALRSGSRDTPSSGLAAAFVPIYTIRDVPGNLLRKNIDLYVGPYTIARARQTKGMDFSTGYMAYRTELLVHDWEECTSLECLAMKNAALGVVAYSSNLWLAHSLRHYDARLSFLNLVSYATRAELIKALEQNNIDAILIDATALSGTETKDTKELLGLRNAPGWKNYVRQYIGNQTLEYGVAVGTDSKGKEDDKYLIRAVNSALSSKSLKAFLRTGVTTH
jgi:ABC-type amino acid transport substrate-binding protein